MATPVITIYVRHSDDCKYKGDEFSKRCQCRKHFRWSRKGKQFRKQAGTRSWEEAEEIKRQRQDHLAGRETRTDAKEDDRYLFWDGESDIVKTWTKYFIAPLFEAAKIERGGNMMSHRLRDTFAVDLLQKGIPLEEVSKLLGHESIKTTERHYAKWIQGRQDRLNALVVGTWTTPKIRRA